MNAMNNMILRASLEAANEDLDGGFDFDFNFANKDPAQFGIATINHPMNYTKDQLDTEIM